MIWAILAVAGVNAMVLALGFLTLQLCRAGGAYDRWMDRLGRAEYEGPSAGPWTAQDKPKRVRVSQDRMQGL